MEHILALISPLERQDLIEKSKESISQFASSAEIMKQSSTPFKLQREMNLQYFILQVRH